MITFIDTSAFIAVLDADDQSHDQALSAWTDLVNSLDPLITSNYTVVETISLLHNRFGLSAVKRFRSTVLPVVTVQWVDEETHERAVNELLGSTRHGPSLVDYVGFEVIRKLRIRHVFAYDHHFEDKGFNLVGQGS